MDKRFGVQNDQDWNPLKDFKNAKIEIHKINNFLMHQFYWDLAKLIINMSKKYDLNFIAKRYIILEHPSIKWKYP